MKRYRFSIFLSTLALLTMLLTGCGGKENAKHDPEKEKAEGKGEGHEHGEEAPAGASFKPGKGVIFTDETRKILGVEVVDVTEQKLPREFAFNVQVFGEKHHHTLNPEDHSRCDVHAAGMVSSNSAASVKPDQPVEVLKGTNMIAAGVVLKVQKALGLGEAEIVVGLSNAATILKPGEFLSAKIKQPRDEAVTVVPASAVLQTSEGTFVYAANGNAFFRTAVKKGSQADGFIEVVDGLLPGDQVVTKPVETLWLIELRATKGGGHSH